MTTPPLPADEIRLPSIQRSGSTLYVLNSAGCNRWSAQVQPGRTDDDERVSDEECEQIAVILADRAARAADGEAAGVVGYPAIQQQYTLAEIEAKLASHDYGAELMLQHAMLLLRARAAVDAEGWTSVETRPEPQMPVLLDIGKKYPIRAMWVPAKSLEVGIESNDEFGEYDEATDEYYCPEGWYEWNANEETHWLVTDTPVRWMALPTTAAPGPASPTPAAVVGALPLPVPYDEHERQVFALLNERDNAGEWADDLAERIADITETDIGEHSSDNCPWYNAVEAADAWMAEDLRRIAVGEPEQPRRAMPEYEAMQAEIAGHESAARHLGRLVDDLRGVVARAMATMKTLHKAAKPDESGPDIDAIVPGADFRRFVDAHARLLHDVKHLPEAPASKPTTTSLLDRATDLHEKAFMPWREAERLALSEAGIGDADIDELIGEAAPTGLSSYLLTEDDLREFARAVLVHQPAASVPAPHVGDVTMTDALAAGDGGLQAAIDYWQDRALKAEKRLPAGSHLCAFNPGCSSRCDVCPEDSLPGDPHATE